MIYETKRLYTREMREDDIPSLEKILKDKETMEAYEHTFSDEEVREWLQKQRKRYKEYGFGLWAVILKESGEMIGQCGLSIQEAGGREVLEIGYLFQREYWHKGYASEAAAGCKKYAFEVLEKTEVCSIIRDTNIASMNVAIRNGMVIKNRCIRHYYGMDMPHYVFFVER